MATKAKDVPTSARTNQQRRIRKIFGNIHEISEMPNLIEVQRESYEQFLRSDPKTGYISGLEKTLRSALMLLHVLEPVSYGLDFTLGQSKARRLEVETWTKRLEELVSSHQHPTMQVESQLRGGFPADSILDSAQTLPCDLIVMGTHGRRGISHTISGSVAEAVLRKARCPVITVRSPKLGPGSRQTIPEEDSPVLYT